MIDFLPEISSFGPCLLNELLLLSAGPAASQDSLDGYERLERKRRRDMGYTRKSKVVSKGKLERQHRVVVSIECGA